MTNHRSNGSGKRRTIVYILVTAAVASMAAPGALGVGASVCVGYCAEGDVNTTTTTNSSFGVCNGNVNVQVTVTGNNTVYQCSHQKVCDEACSGGGVPAAGQVE